MGEVRNLNLGCGDKEFPNSLNVDLRQTPIVDVQHDLNVFPYPFQDESFNNIHAHDIIEHLDDVIEVMDECWRLLKPNGTIYIRTTAWDTQQSYNDITHKHWFTLESFDFFDPDTKWGAKYWWYTIRKWRVVLRQYDGQELVFHLQKRVHWEDKDA